MNGDEYGDPCAGRGERHPRPSSHLWVPQTLHTPRDLLILVEQATEPVVPSDLVDLVCCPMGW